MEWYLMVWKKFAEFSGRSRRKEYWIFQLINSLIYFTQYIAGYVFMKNGIAGIIFVLCLVYFLAAFIPSLAVSVRRLHDIGKSGWFLLIVLIPLIGGIVLIVFMAMDGESVPNEYGPDPKLA